MAGSARMVEPVTGLRWITRRAAGPVGIIHPRQRIEPYRPLTIPGGGSTTRPTAGAAAREDSNTLFSTVGIGLPDFAMSDDISRAPMQKPFQRGENSLRGYCRMCSKNVFA